MASSHYREPFRDGDRLSDRWRERVVRFDELTCEHNAQRAWYFDYETTAGAIELDIRGEQMRRAELANEALRQRFLALWPNFDHSEESYEEWDFLRGEFAARDIVLPETPGRDSSLRGLLIAVLSARAGKPVGWRFKTLAEVAHHLMQGYPQHMLAFGYAIRHFGRQQLLMEQDESGRWRRKQKALRAVLRDRDPAFMPETASMAVLRFLFPAIGTELTAFIERGK